MQRYLLFLLALTTLGGCATSPKPLMRHYNAQELFHHVCTPGGTLQAVRGEVRLKLKSKEISGQFNASVRVFSQLHMKIEVTNILGGTEAMIDITDNQIEVIRTRGDQQKEIRTADAWGGVPLKRIIQLFLGQIPCPSRGDVVELRNVDESSLLIQTRQEEYLFRVVDQDGEPWPETLEWKSLGTSPLFVRFDFDKPEGGTRSPTKWDAKSKSDSISVRWRHRSF